MTFTVLTMKDQTFLFRYFDAYCAFTCRDIFSLGFGPFRWVCTSGLPEDLRQTDAIATSVLQSIINGIEFFRKHYIYFEGS